MTYVLCSLRNVFYFLQLVYTKKCSKSGNTGCNWNLLVKSKRLANATSDEVKMAEFTKQESQKTEAQSMLRHTDALKWTECR